MRLDVGNYILEGFTNKNGIVTFEDDQIFEGAAVMSYLFDINEQIIGEL